MVEQLGEGLLVVLLQLIILIEEFFLFFLVLELQGSVLENVHNDVLWLLFKENVADTQQTGKLLELAVDNPFDRREILLVSEVEHQNHLTKTS